jgi:hypothetical protein
MNFAKLLERRAPFYNFLRWVFFWTLFTENCTGARNILNFRLVLPTLAEIRLLKLRSDFSWELSKLAVLDVVREYSAVLVLRQRELTLCVQVPLELVILALDLGVDGVHGDVSFLETHLPFQILVRALHISLFKQFTLIIKRY